MRAPDDIANACIVDALQPAGTDEDTVPVVELSIADLRHNVSQAIEDARGDTFQLLAACKAQHEAIDWLMASLAQRDKTFLPSKSPVWPAIEQGHAAIKAAEASDG